MLKPLCICAMLALLVSGTDAAAQNSAASTGTASNALAAQVAKAPNAMPLLVSTYKLLQLSQVKPGDPMVLQVMQRWEGTGCVLASGATVQGQFAQVTHRSKTDPNASFELVVNSADCNGNTAVPVGLVAAAMMAPAGGSTGQSGVVEAPPLSDLPLSISGGLRSASVASDLNNYSPRGTLVLPSSVKRGDVIHIPDVALSVGTGPHGGSVVTARKRDLRLERGTLFVLAAASRETVPARSAGPVNAAANPGAASAPIAAAPKVDAADVTEVCNEGCSNLAAHPASAAEGAAMRGLSMRSLGYSPHDKRLMTEFNRETTLTFLDEGTLLCTFDPHYLREHDTYREDGARTVRAVLVDTHTLSVRRVVEWRVRGNDAYLWRAGNGNVLVHMGHELQLLDKDLHVQHRLRLEGRIAFLTVSPAGDRIAVGTIRERYSEDVHRQLAADLAQEPEEPVDVRVLDGALQTLAAAERSTRSPPPVLDATGELRLVRESAGRWKLGSFGWDRSQTTIATLRSACRPELSVPGGGMTFVVGCTATGSHWYRMLRADGRPVLKADSPSEELMQTSDESGGDRFAVRVVHAARAMTPGQQFSRADLTSEVIGVYRARDGKPVSTITANDFALGRDTYALSPEGDALVLAGTKDLFFYALPKDAADR